MIPLSVPNLSGNEARYLAECIATTFVSTVGPFVERLEKMVAEAAGAQQAVATSAGTTGLHVALHAVGVRPGDLVCLPSYTFIASANAISHCGATPWLFDIAPESWTLDPRQLDQKLDGETRIQDGRLIHKASGRPVSAIMPVHTLGLPADMDAIVLTAKRFGLPVVADGAAALGSAYKGQPTGKMGADLAVVSFNGNKTVTSGGGGAVAGDDPALMGLVRHLVSTARTGDDYTHDRIGFNYRMTNIEAAVGCAQMERLGEFVQAKRRIRMAYDAALSHVPGVGLFPEPAWATSACWFSGVTLAPPAPTPEQVRRLLRDAGIEARPFWKPMHLQEPYKNAPRAETPVADGIWRRVLTLPCSTHLTSADQERVIEVLIEALGG
jgi:perosamine synthetase